MVDKDGALTREGYGSAPLEGVRILCLTSGVAGPRAGRILAELGAEVIKVESRHGGIDPFRLFSKNGSFDDLNASTRYAEVNFGVKSVTLNLRTDQGRKLAKQLAAASDVVLENFRPGVLERLDMSPNDLLEHNPRLVIVRSSGVGSSGVKKNLGTWGPSLMAYSGMTYLWNDDPVAAPSGSQSVYPDYLVSNILPGIVIAGLLEARSIGAGRVIESPQISSLIYSLGISIVETSVTGDDAIPEGNTRRKFAPYNIYRCKGEDSWCAIGTETDAQWSRFAAEAQLPVELVKHWQCASQRWKDRDEIDARVAEWTIDQNSWEVMERLQAIGVPAGVVQSNEELYNDPQLSARGFIKQVDQPNIGALPVAAIPLRHGDGRVVNEPGPAPLLGADNEYVICEILGYDRTQLDDLIAEDIVA